MGPIVKIASAGSAPFSMNAPLPPPTPSVFIPAADITPPSSGTQKKPFQNSCDDFLRRIEMQMTMDAKKGIPATHLTYVLPFGKGLIIDWADRERELWIQIKSKQNENAFQEVWEEMTGTNGTINRLSETIGRKLRNVENYPFSSAVTWAPLDEEDRPWSVFQLRHHHNRTSQGITLSLKVPPQSEPMQWIRACLESLFGS